MSNEENGILNEKGFMTEEDFTARLDAIKPEGNESYDAIRSEIIDAWQMLRDAFVKQQAEIADMLGRLRALRVDNARLLMRVEGEAPETNPGEDAAPKTFEELW